MNNSEKILIIDDEVGPREALRMILKDRYYIKTASSAEEGLSYLSTGEYGLVILDIKMPNMDGITALKEIKRLYPDIEVLMVTAYASLETARNAVQFGAIDYMIKPFDMNYVLKIVDKGIRKRRSHKEHTEEHARLQELVHERTKELKITEQMLWELFQNANDGIIIMDETGSIITANQKACEIYGYNVDELFGKNVNVLESEKTRKLWQERLVRLLRGDSLLFETEYYKRDGTKVYLEISARAINLDDRLLIQSFQRDITEKKRLHSMLLHSQKMESIGTLAGGIAHDFNTILTSVYGYAELILASEAVSPEAEKMLRTISSAAKQGSDMTSKLLSFARKREIELKPFSINMTVKETVDIVSSMIPASISLRTTLNDTLPEIEGDSEQIKQVIMNLIINARDAMPDGGELMLETGLVELRNGVLHIPADVRKGQYLYLNVRDTGIGIPEESINRIFEPFYTTKGYGRGTGLGLAMAYGIIKEHGGYIAVDSKKGHGSAFSIYLPVSREELMKEARK